MKFNKIRLSGASDVDLPILGLDAADPYILKSVDGLGPPEIDVAVANTIQEGGVYRGRRAQNRQVVMRVGLHPDWDDGQTPEELRTTLYNLLTPKFARSVKAKMMWDDDIIALAEGQISRFEISVFAKDPEIQITLNCFSPYLMAPEIEYQIPAKTPIVTNTAIDVQNTGTAPAGFWLGVTLTAPQATLRITDDSNNVEKMTIGGGWEAGDTLIVDTRAGQRGVWKIESGDTDLISVLGNLSGTSTWLQLYHGENRYLINSLAFDWYLEGFGHTPAYWGV